MRYDWTVTIDGTDVSQWVKAAGTIDYGRPSRFTGFQAPTAIFELFTRDENPNPAPVTWPDVDLGAAVIIHVTPDGINQWRRFTGIVQALDWGLYGLQVTATGYDIDAENTPGYYGSPTDWQFIAPGTVDGMPEMISGRPSELETERITWLVEDKSPFHVQIEGVPARRVRSIPAQTIGQPLLDQVLRVADDCDALLLQDRLGVMRYRTKNFTRPARLTLNPVMVESTSIDLALERGTTVDTVTVYYGEPDPATGNQRAVTETTNQQGNVERRVELYTDIRFQSGARGKAKDYLALNQPAWEAPDLTVLMSLAPTIQDAEDILQLQEAWRVRVSPLPAGCPIPQYDADVLGFTEVMHETDYRVILHLAPSVDLDPEEPVDVIYPDGILTGHDQTGTTYDAVNDKTYRWVAFTQAGSFTLTNTHTEEVICEALAVAGGGGGGAWLYPGGPAVRPGGGGGGRVGTGSYTVPVGPTAVTVGDGGTPGNPSGGQYYGSNGGDTLLGAIRLPGGGGGGGSAEAYVANQWTPGVGKAGGSGGGAGGSATPGGPVPGVGFAGMGNQGGYGGNGGGGGGALGAGGNPTGGPGLVSSITGTPVEVGKGGSGGQSGGPGTLPGEGGGGSYAGTSQAPGYAGYRGLVVLKYRIG